jgi:hypothetical protein
MANACRSQFQLTPARASSGWSRLESLENSVKRQRIDQPGSLLDSLVNSNRQTGGIRKDGIF